MSNIDMLPTSYKEEKQKYRMDIVCVIVFVVMMVSLLAIEYITGKGYSTISAEHKKQAAVFEQREAEMKACFDISTQRTQKEGRLRVMLNLSARFPVSLIFSEITEVAAGTTVTMTQMKIRREYMTPEEELAAEMKAKQTTTVASSRQKKDAKPPPPKGLARVFIIEAGGVAAADKDIETFMNALRKSEIFKDAVIEIPWEHVHKRELNKIDCYAFQMTIVLDKRATKPKPAKPAAVTGGVSK